MLRQISEHLYLYEDTCNVYIVKNEHMGVLIDFGSGQALRELPALGITHVEGVLVTHHHRDQLQGLLLAEEDISVWAPHTEQDLIASADQMWQSREISNNYNTRQDRFSILENFPIRGTLKDYASISLAGYSFTIWPTPGHTTGSISILMDLDGKRLAFTGDLIYAPGKVWSLAATQWTYNGGEGIPFSILSLLSLLEQKVCLLLPSHGLPMDGAAAIPPTVDSLSELLRYRRHNPRLFELRESPYQKLTEHLLFNRTSMSNSYVLISRSGKALIIDFGYDFIAGIAVGVDRSARRPWLYTIPALMEAYGILSIDACLPTHYHDDHVAGFNLLRDTYNTKVMCPESFADVLENPFSYDIPCLWHDPIPVDRRLPLHTPVQWEEYELIMHPLSGHTRYSVAVEFQVDGKKVLCGGDQYANEDGLSCNYVYKNLFTPTDFIDSARLYAAVRPDLILTGHWQQFTQGEAYLDAIEEHGKDIARLHAALLPYEEYRSSSSDFCAVFYPYRMTVSPGETAVFSVDIINPLREDGVLTASLVLPHGFRCGTPSTSANVKTGEKITFHFELTVPCTPMIRARIGCDIQVNNRRLGQQAEMLFTIQPDTGPQQA